MLQRCSKFATVILPLALGLGACATRPAPPDPRAPSAPESQATNAAEPATPAVSAEAQQQFDAALALMKGNHTEQAARELQTLGTRYPELPGPLLNLGILHLKAKRYGDAETSFKEVLQRDPQSTAAYNYLGIVYRNLGRFKDAESAYRQALAIDESYALAHLNLGVLYDLYLQQPERALAEFERYLQLAPAPEPQVAGWVRELQRRTGNTKNAGGANSGASAAAGNEVKS